MKVIMLAKYMSYSQENPWLTDELASELCRQGNRVHVVLLDRSGEWPEGTHDVAPGLKVTAYPLITAKSRGGLSARFELLLRWRKVIRDIKALKLESNDLVINFSIAALFSGVAKHLKNTGSAKKSLLVLWDFFPIHQLEIGRLKSKLLGRLLYSFEHSEIASYDYVGLMSEKNIEFFNQYHPNVDAKTLRLPIWGARPEDAGDAQASTQAVINELVDPAYFNIIFGGQLVKGRGVEQIVELARRIRTTLPNVRFLILGDGELRPSIERRIERDGVDNVLLRKRVDRDAYRAVVQACNAGLVITVSGVSIPSFPSKVIDYMLAKKPVIACTEDTSDFGEYIEQRYQCGLSATTGDLEGLQACVEKLQGDPELCKALGDRAYEAFANHHDVVSVAKTVSGLIQNG